MTATAILSVPGVVPVPAVPASGGGAFGHDVGQFGALIVQQASPQPLAPMSTPMPMDGKVGTTGNLPGPAESLALPGEGGEAAMPPTLPVMPDGEAAPEADPADGAAHPAPAPETDAAPAPPAPPPIAGPAPDPIERAPVAVPLEPAPAMPDAGADTISDGALTHGDEDDAVIDAPDVGEKPSVSAQAPAPTPAPASAQALTPPAALQPTGHADTAASSGDDSEASDGAARREPAVDALRGHDRSARTAARTPDAARGDADFAASNAPQSASAAAGSTPAEAGGAIAPADTGEGGLSSPLLTQTMPAIAAKPAAGPYLPATHLAPHQPVVRAEAGAFGGHVGKEIAKVARAGRDDLLIRLDPREMGRVDVRLSFDNDGVLRAVLSADSPAALDMLRRESGDLGRALADAGVRADGQSLRFDARSGGQGAGSGETGGRDPQHQGGSPPRGDAAEDGARDVSDPTYRSLRASGHVDLMA